MNFPALARAKIHSPGEAAHAHSEEGRTALPSAAQLHELYLDEVFRFAARRLERREDAEDVCAETFAAAFEQLPRFRGEVEVRLWLLGIARRKVADALRRHARRREIAWPDEFETPDNRSHTMPARALLREESRQTLRELVAGLKNEQREALLLRYVEDLSIEQIAVVMNRSKAAANSLLQRARASVFRGGKEYFLDQTPDNSTARGEL